LKDSLGADLYQIYEQGLRLKPPYRATRFMQMLEGPGGPESAAHELLRGPAERISDGFTALVYEYSRPDLTVEWISLKEQYRHVFSSDERRIAFDRLSQAAPQWMAANMPSFQP
jgi:hypothetical protein